MKRLLGSLPLFLSWACLVGAQDITLPKEVRGEVGLVIVEAKTTKTAVGWYSPDSLQIVPSDFLAKKTSALVIASRQGRFRLIAWTGPEGYAETVLVIGVIPRPPDDPDPPTPPEPKPPDPKPPDPPKPPEPLAGLRVIFAYESSANMTREQLNILHSTTINKYLTEKVTRDETPAGRMPAWQKWDKDQDVRYAPQPMRDLWESSKPLLNSLPALIIANGQKAQVFPLPATEAETLALLKKFGG